MLLGQLPRLQLFHLAAIWQRRQPENSPIARNTEYLLNLLQAVNSLHRVFNDPVPTIAPLPPLRQRD